MVGGDGVDDILRLIVFAEDIRADCGVRSLDFVVNGLADIVEKTDAAGFLLIKSEFRGNSAHERGCFNGVFQHILRETEAEVEPSEQRQKRLRHALNGSVENRLFTVFKEFVVDFLADLLDKFLNAGRVNTSVGNQFFEQTARGLLADRIEAGDNDSLGGVVDQNVDSGRRFERADVAAFTADDASLHLIVRQRDCGGCALVGAVAGITLDCGNHQFLRFAFGALLSLVERVADQNSAFVFDFTFELFENQSLRGLSVHSGNPFELGDLVGNQLFEFLILVCQTLLRDFEIVLLLFEIANLGVERIFFAGDVFLFLSETLLRGELLAAAVADFILERLFEFYDIRLCGYAGFAEDLIGLLLRVAFEFLIFSRHARPGCFCNRDANEVADDASACESGDNPYSSH